MGSTWPQIWVTASHPNRPIRSLPAADNTTNHLIVIIHIALTAIVSYICGQPAMAGIVLYSHWLFSVFCVPVNTSANILYIANAYNKHKWENPTPLSGFVSDAVCAAVSNELKADI